MDIFYKDFTESVSALGVVVILKMLIFSICKQGLHSHFLVVFFLVVIYSFLFYKYFTSFANLFSSCDLGKHICEWNLKIFFLLLYCLPKRYHWFLCIDLVHCHFTDRGSFLLKFFCRIFRFYHSLTSFSKMDFRNISFLTVSMISWVW